MMCSHQHPTCFLRDAVQPALRHVSPTRPATRDPVRGGRGPAGAQWAALPPGPAAPRSALSPLPRRAVRPRGTAPPEQVTRDGGREPAAGEEREGGGTVGLAGLRQGTRSALRRSLFPRR